MKNRKIINLFSIFTLIILNACQPAWTIKLNSDRLSTSLSQVNFQALKKEYSETEGCEGLPFNVVLYASGYEVIDSVILKDSDSQDVEIDWEEKGEAVCLKKNGRINLNSQEYNTKELIISEETFDPAITRIIDIAPTVLSALGIDQGSLPGKMLTNERFEHVVLVFLDGFGYAKFEQALDGGLINNLAKALSINKGLTIFPPRTTIASAAVMTGVSPNKNGVYETGIRKTDAVTIFDLIKDAGLKSIAVEGGSLAFNMRNTEVILSGDRDLNGGTDDNVFINAEEVIKSRMPDLLWVHFHGIDDSGHTYGPESQQVDDKIVEVDNYYGRLISILPENTLIIAFADHGMHPVTEEGRSGNHGNLIFSDMVIPIILEIK
jgi:hypothetical protein